MPADLVKFGDDFEFDRRAYELRRAGSSLKLERIPMELLSILLERRGELVSRDEIVERIWGKDVFLDTDNSINAAVRKIRYALKDDPERPRFLQTVTAKGYRFIAQVVEVGPPEFPPQLRPEGQASAVASVPTHVTNHRVLAKRIILLIIPALLAAAAAYWRWAQPGDGPVNRRMMLAVLPFANLSGDPAQDYFSDGLTEETITDLGELNPEKLGVIARTSAMAYKGKSKSIAQIGRELGVDYVLEGSVRREGNDARITAQLIRVRDQSHLWAHTYTREVGGLLALQDELGRAIAQQVRVELTLSRAKANRGISNAEAYEAYLKGRYYLAKRTIPDLLKSKDSFEQSKNIEPGFALAYAGLADSYLALAISSPLEFFPKARTAASRALELDQEVADAHAAIGAVSAIFDYDWPGAEQEFKRAIELNSNCADAHYFYATYYLAPLGRWDEAFAEMKRALDLDPLSGIYNSFLGLLYFYDRRYDQALDQLNRTLQLDPDFFIAHYHLAWVYSHLGKYPEAIGEFSRARILAGQNRSIVDADESILRKAFARDGPQGFWKEMASLNAEHGRNVGEFDMPQVYARLGQKERALGWLETTIEERASLATFMNVDPGLDPLRGDARFEELLARMGLSHR
jgi:TolB-like protein/DNA-binding winged helix-turn-helix (wHTH) protein/Tfp pilus assembly protein PilF